MKELYYQLQLVGDNSSMKRMVASLYLSNAKQQEQTLKVCICDDLPHVVKSFTEQQRLDQSFELLQAGLTVSVSYDRTLSVSASITNHQDYVCTVIPNYEVVIPPERIWSPGATVAVEFKAHMIKSNENASVQVSILSQDEGGNEIPLSVPPRIHLMWQPKNVAGVTRLREAWESSSDGSISPQRRSWAVRQGPQPYLQHYTNPTHKSISLPRHQQPAFSKLDAMVQKKATRMQEVEEELRRQEQRLQWEKNRKLEGERKAAEAKEEEQRLQWEEKRRLEEERKAAEAQEEEQRLQWEEEKRRINKHRLESEAKTEQQRWEKRKWREEEREVPYAKSDDQSWHASSIIPQHEAEWNVVKDPLNNMYKLNGGYDDANEEPLPDWAKGLGDDFNYDDVVVV